MAIRMVRPPPLTIASQPHVACRQDLGNHRVKALASPQTRPGEDSAMAFDEKAAIDSFWAARARGVYFPTEWFDRLTLDEAYRIQLGLIARRCAAGERQIGWKVGLTAKPIQEQFGFHEPVFGCILESRQSGHVFSPAELIKP